jgi:putative phosphoribosyl transferase
MICSDQTAWHRGIKCDPEKDDFVTRKLRRIGAVNSLVELPFGPGAGNVRFADRRDAGSRLAALLSDLRHENPIVVGIPRGGMPVAAEVARALKAPLDMVVVRKIGAPENPEYAIGALAEDDVLVIEEEALHGLGLGLAELEATVGRARRELAERLARYNMKRPRLAVAGRTVLLADDGLATGRSAQAAARSLRKRGASRVILAVPVATPQSARTLRNWVDYVVSVEMPVGLWAIGLWYEDFGPTSDEEVKALLSEPTG